jgi:hypothetical protein
MGLIDFFDSMTMSHSSLMWSEGITLNYIKRYIEYTMNYQKK